MNNNLSVAPRPDFASESSGLLESSRNRRISAKLECLSKSFEVVFADQDKEEWEPKLRKVVEFMEVTFPSLKETLPKEGCQAFYLSKKVFPELTYSCLVTPDTIRILIKKPFNENGKYKIVELVIDYNTSSIDGIRIKSRKNYDAKSTWENELKVFRKIIEVAKSKTGDLEGIFVPTLVESRKIRYTPWYRSVSSFFSLFCCCDRKRNLEATKTLVFATKCTEELIDYFDIIKALKDPEKSEMSKRIAYSIAKSIKNFHITLQFAHRDLKPDNFIIVDNGVIVIDFGFAQPLEILSRSRPGTAGYAPPEFYDSDACDLRKTDAWGLGLLIFMYATLRQPEFSKFQQMNGGIRISFKEEFLKLVCAFHKKYKNDPNELIQIALKLLVIDPKERMSVPQACQELSKMFRPANMD